MPKVKLLTRLTIGHSSLCTIAVSKRAPVSVHDWLEAFHQVVSTVPSLIGLAWRAPYMHQGCAATLADRFGTCGGGDAHGKTSQLSAEQRADLIAFLETL